MVAAGTVLLACTAFLLVTLYHRGRTRAFNDSRYRIMHLQSVIKFGEEFSFRTARKLLLSALFFDDDFFQKQKLIKIKMSSIITIYLPTTTGMCRGTGTDVSDHHFLPGKIHHHIRIQIGLRHIQETVHRTVSGRG